MKWLVKFLDEVLIQILWIGFLLYNAFTARRNKKTTEDKWKHTPPNDEHKKRHFIHLYNTTSSNGQPECYMDVYEMFSPSDEQLLRAVCAKGVPNSTYWKCKNDVQKQKYMPKTWFGYSTIAM